MSKKPESKLNDELKPEYELRGLLKNGVRGKYVKRYRAGTNLVLLEADVAEAFPSEQSVNETLRLVMRLTKLQNGKKHKAAKA
jgi:hypothetical protein